MVRVSKQPLYPGKIVYPIAIKRRNDDKVVRKGEVKRFKKKLSWQKAYKACKLIIKRKIKSKDTYLKLSCHPNSTLSVKSIIGILEDWAKEGWTPDVIVIDYADILNMDYSFLEGRDRINETWKQLRALSQKYHCLVVTATQADAASYTKDIVNMSNFSEDKRKLSHVTGVVGINATTKEKDLGIMRLNWVVLREGFYNTKRCVHVAGCLDIANPAIKSCF